MVRAEGYVAAVDLGASSGRVIVGHVSADGIRMHEVHRFPNGPVPVLGKHRVTLRWDMLRLLEGVQEGLRRAVVFVRSRDASLLSIAVDTWGVDYGLLDSDGELIGNPVHYRDRRTELAVPAYAAVVPPEVQYQRCGLHPHPFNTLFQLVASSGEQVWRTAADLVFLPDLINYWLTGEVRAELTMASTTGLLDVQRRAWSEDTLSELRAHFGMDLGRLLPTLVEPGAVLGHVDPRVARVLDLEPDGALPLVLAAASHDTASAVVSVPARSEHFAFISSGTWTLVGLELTKPVVTEEARLAGMSNELGPDGTVRFLQNVMGLWMLNECLREWGLGSAELPGLIQAAAACEPLRTVVDARDVSLLPPGDMPGRLAILARAGGQPEPADRPSMVRCIHDSLALCHRIAIREAQDLSGTVVDSVHMVGGGVRNRLLAQLTADATELPVVAGPVEGAALGNVLIQARGLGLLEGSLMDLRQVRLIGEDFQTYTPSGDPPRWAEAAERLS